LIEFVFIVTDYVHHIQSREDSLLSS